MEMLPSSTSTQLVLSGGNLEEIASGGSVITARQHENGGKTRNRPHKSSSFSSHTHEKA